MSKNNKVNNHKANTSKTNNHEMGGTTMKTKVNSSASTSTSVKNTSKGGNGMNNNVKSAIETIVKAVELGHIDLDAIAKAIDNSKKNTTADSPKTSARRPSANATRKPRTKAYSVDNVREMQRMIMAGKTTQQILDRFGLKSPTTIRNYISEHNVYEGNIKRYMDKLHENNMAAKKAKESDVVEVETEEVKPVEVVCEAKTEDNSVVEPECVAEEVSENVSNGARYLLDSNLIKCYDARCKWDELIGKLKEENAEVFVHCRKKIKYFAKKHLHGSARILATEVLNDKNFTVIDTPLNVEWTAATIGAVVITHLQNIQEYCKKAGVEYIMLDDYLASSNNSTANEEYKLDPDDEEATKWVKKLSLPVQLNNNKRAICEVSEIAKFAEKKYGEEAPDVMVFDSEGKERKTPTGKLRLQTGDQVKITGKEISVTLKICAETESENCYEVYYAKTTAEEASTVKTA